MSCSPGSAVADAGHHQVEGVVEHVEHAEGDAVGGVEAAVDAVRSATVHAQGLAA